DVRDKSAVMSAAIPDVAIRRAPFDTRRGSIGLIMDYGASSRVLRKNALLGLRQLRQWPPDLPGRGQRGAWCERRACAGGPAGGTGGRPPPGGATRGAHARAPPALPSWAPAPGVF